MSAPTSRSAESAERPPGDRNRSDDPDAGSAPEPVHPDRWLAVLRIGVGFWFLKSLWSKLEVTSVAGFLPVPVASERWVGFMPEQVAEYAAGNPLLFYRDFLQEVVVPNGAVFANLTAFGEVAIGIGLVLGLLTRWTAAVGLFVAANYLLATFWMSPGQMGFHLLLVLCMIAFGAAAAGRRWGLDGWLRSGAGSPAGAEASAAPRLRPSVGA